MDLQLTDRVFLLTGAARGLGRATADVLVAEGARVVISGRDRASLDGAVAELGDRAVGVAGDNADPAQAGRMVDAAFDTWGRLDGALVSVGGPPAKSVMDTTDEEWTAAFGSVFLGAVRIARTVARAARGGWLDRLRAVQLGAGADRRAGHLQRPAPRPRDGGQDPGRRARPARDPGQRADARPDRDRTAPRARRPWRRPGGVAGEVARRHPAAHGTDGPRSSAGRRRSCSARRRHSCRA